MAATIFRFILLAAMIFDCGDALQLFVNCTAPQSSPGTMTFNTLNGARDYIRLLPRPLTENVVVNIVSAECNSPSQGAGILTLDKPALDSGSTNFSITYQTDPSQTSPALLNGGVYLNAAGWSASTDPSVASGVWVYDLSPLDIDIGAFTTWGTIQRCTPNRSELFYGGVPMTIARYPNINSLDAWNGPWMDWLFLNTSQGQTILAKTNSKLAEWTAGNKSSPSSFAEAWLHGFYHADWCDDWLQATNWSTNGTFVFITFLKRPCGSVANNARFRVVNLLTELDMAGEYFINISSKVLYFMPPDRCFPNCQSQAAPILGKTYAPLINIVGNVSYVTFQRLQLSFGRSHGVQVAATPASPAIGLQFLNLTVSNIGADGLNLVGVVKALVDSLTSKAAGCRPVFISGGNTASLSRSDSTVQN